METAMVWIQFFVLASLIGIAGFYLSVQADQIAEKTGLGRNLIGIILLATITSLPELMTGLSSVTIADNPNLAIGDVLGSCVFNLSLVFFLDLIYREGSIYSKATQGHVLTAALGVIMIGVVGFSLALRENQIIPSVFHIGASSILIPVLYFMAMKLTYSFEKTHSSDQELVTKDVQSIKRNLIIFSIAAIVIIAAGSFLPFVGENIMHTMGWESAFVGTIFMAFATSLPEIAVTISAVKMRAVDMAFSNVLGSNLFNIMILAIDDFAYRKGPLLSDADPGHVITVFTALLMTGVVTIALITPPQKRVMKTTSSFSLIVLLLFILNIYVIYKN